MKRIAGKAATALLLSAVIAGFPGYAAGAVGDLDPGDRSDTGSVHTSGVSGTDQRGIMQVGPSATDWVGLSRSQAYWVADRGDDATIRMQQAGAGAGEGPHRSAAFSWGWLGLLGLIGLWRRGAAIGDGGKQRDGQE